MSTNQVFTVTVESVNCTNPFCRPPYQTNNRVECLRINDVVYHGIECHSELSLQHKDVSHLPGPQESVYPDHILPIMSIKPPLSTIKRYVEIMEQMIERDNGEKAAGRPGCRLVNEQRWPTILSEFLSQAACLNPSEEVLRFLMDKGAKLPRILIAALASSDKTPKQIVTVLAAYVKLQLTLDEKNQIRSDETITKEQKDAKIAELTAQTNALFSKYQPKSYSPEALRLILEAASRPPAEDDPQAT